MTDPGYSRSMTTRDEPKDETVSDATANVDPESVRAIEAVVLVAVEPVPSEQLAQLLELPVATIEELCGRLAASYDEAGHGFELVKVAGGWRYQTRADLSPYVERFLLDGQRARMSGAALETLAIIAYKQPISRVQLSSIRGVNVEATLRTLVARGYVEEIGHDPSPGNPVLFGTTRTFLERLGLDSLDELPPIADFVPDASVVESLERGLRMPVTLDDSGDDSAADGAEPAGPVVGAGPDGGPERG